MTLCPLSINFMEKWIRLQETLEKVMKLEKVSMAIWNESFNIIYYMCLSQPKNYKYELYNSTKLFLNNHLLKLLSIIKNGGNANLCQNYHTYWERYTKSVIYLENLYYYLNRLIKYKKPTCIEGCIKDEAPDDVDVMEIDELCFDLWKQHIIIPLKDSLSVLLLDEFDNQGRFKSTSAFLDMMSSIIHSFVGVYESKEQCFQHHTVYESYFEQPFLERSSKYFKCYVDKLLHTDTVSQYLLNVSDTLKQEEIYSKKYFFESTDHKLLEVCHQQLIGDHLEFMLNEREAMIKEERLNDMRIIYLLLSKSNKDLIFSLVDIFREHVKQCAISAIKSIKQEQIYIHIVEETLILHKKFKTMVFDVFKDDPCFNRAVNKAFEEVINHEFVDNQPQKSAEYLSKYCNYFLKKSAKGGLNEANIDDILSQIIIIFRYIDNKDVFQKFYQKYLAKRLIHQQSRSIDAEEEMINKLKKTCGSEYTNNFCKMLVDIKASEEVIGKFHTESLKSKDKLNVMLSVLVLQSGVWPLGSLPESTFCIPKQLMLCTQSFEEFYKSNHSGRRLNWIHHHCQGELKLNYLPKVYKVTMQAFQMAILLLFEESNTFKYSAISELLEVTNDQFLQKHIKSLVECKLLLMDGGDNVSLNMAYFNEHNKLRISAVVQKDNTKEKKQTIKSSVEGDRIVYVQAAVVRIMKYHKILIHNQLMSEVLTQSKTFTPTISLVDKCIEALINKGYLERTPNVTDCYSYVA